MLSLERSRKLRVYTAFAVFGIILGSYSIRAPDLQSQLNLSSADFGLVLIGLPAGILFANAFMCGVVSWLGAWRSVLVFGTLFALIPIATALAGSAVGFLVALVGQGMVLSLFNIATNLEASDVACKSGDAVIHKCHAFWGLAMLAITGFATQLIAWQIETIYQFVFVGTLCVLVLVAASFIGTTHSKERLELPANVDPIRMTIPGKAVRQIFFLGAALIAIEGIMRNWVIIHIRDSIGGGAELAAWSLTLFVLCQTSGRFAAGSLLRRLGNRGLHRVSLIVSALGCAGLAIAPNSVIALVSTCFVGVGVSTIFPQSIAAITSCDGASSADNIAAFSLLQTLTVYFAPVLFGFLSEEVGYRAVYGLLCATPLITFSMAAMLNRTSTSFFDFEN